jgi:hypothetical protein
MTNKRFLVPVLAFMAFGLLARANIVVYCDSGCGMNTAAFSSVLALDGYVYASTPDLTFTGSLTDGGLQYLDSGLTNVLFASPSSFTIPGSALQATANKGVTITVPASYAAIQLNVSQVGGGFDFTCYDTACDGAPLSSTPITLDYLNTTPGASWAITITPGGVSSEQLVINSFDPAGLGTGSGDSSTPEVGTLFLIGAGLIAMRWMKRAPRRLFRNPQADCRLTAATA